MKYAKNKAMESKIHCKDRERADDFASSRKDIDLLREDNNASLDDDNASHEDVNPITEGKIHRALLLFFAPIFFSSLVQQSYSIVDAVIVGNFAGKGALAAVDSIYVVIKLLINVFISVAAGGSILIARYYGAKDYRSAGQTVNTLLRFSLFGGIAITVVGVIWTPLFTAWMNVPDDIFDSSVLYLRVYFSGTLFSLFFNICSGVLRALGDSKRPFSYMLVSAGLNVALDLILVAGFRLDIAGVAIATVASQAVSAFLALRCLLYGAHSRRIHSSETRTFSRSAFLRILRLGIPMGMTTVLYAVSNMYMQGAINSFGTDNIAAWAICGKMDFLIWTLSDTMGITVTTFMAQNYGAGKYRRMRDVLRFAMIYTFLGIGSVSFLLYALHPSFASIFNGDVGVLSAVSAIMTQIAPFYLLYSVGEVLSGAMRGFGSTVLPMLITLAGTCFFRIVWILFLVPMNPSFLTVMWGYPASWMVTTGMFAVFGTVYMIRMIRRTEHSPRTV